MNDLTAVEPRGWQGRGLGSLAVAGTVLVWCVWAAATVAAILFVRHYTRNIPYWDDFFLVPVMTGHESLSYQWLAAQHSEHRPVIPKLILGLLLRAIPDFRAALYLNVGILSATAAWMILLARRIRGRTHLVDAALPLAILCLAQCECLMIAFALNLIMTAGIVWWLIRVFSRAAISPAWWSCIQVGGMLCVLPLCGGSGLILMPPLVLWLTGYIACDWWSGRSVGPWARGLSVGLLIASAAITAWYIAGYVPPSYIPPTPSARAALKVALEVMSLSIGPIHLDWTRQDAGFYLGYWKLAGMAVLLLSAATFVRLAIAARRSAEERPRALGLIGLLIAQLGVAASVGVSRSGMSTDMGMSSRYVTIAVPMFGIIFLAWLIYGSARVRRAIHGALFTLACLGFLVEVPYARNVGQSRLDPYVRIERALKNRLPTSRLVPLAHRTLWPDRNAIYESFKLLKAAGVGKFRNLVDDGLVAATNPEDKVRR